MFENKANRIEDRIVSTSQPHVRPIKRGKAIAFTGFGAKISVSLINGYGFVDRLSWDSYNESGDLIAQIKKYRQLFGCWPESVHADKIYRNSGPPLGRLRKSAERTESRSTRMKWNAMRLKAISGRQNAASGSAE